MAVFLTDTFTEAATVALDAHTGETGATWTKHANSGAGVMTIAAGTDRLRVSTTGGDVLYYASGTPGSADYEVFANTHCYSGTNTNLGVAGRIDTAAHTSYSVEHSTNLDNWRLKSTVAGVETVLGTFAETLGTDQVSTVKLEMIGTAIKVYIDGVQQISVTDSSITAAGKAGVRGATGVGATAGFQLLDMTATDLAGGAPVVPQRTLVGVGT